MAPDNISMRAFLIIITMGLSCCGQSSQQKKSTIDKAKKGGKKPSGMVAIGKKIQGDFNGDGEPDFATAVKVKEGRGNPVEDGTADEYEIRFSGNKMKSIEAGCCEIRLVNEGDLDNDGADEISIFQAPMNGCTSEMTTYSFANSRWKQVVETFLIPTGCERISDRDLQKRVFKENGTVYYYSIDPNDEEGKLVKKKNRAQ
jgi:hypothetical protein